MIGKLNHVGVVTPSIDDAVKMYRDLLGATSATDKWAMPEQGVWVCFVNLPNSQIELIEPLSAWRMLEARVGAEKMSSVARIGPLVRSRWPPR